MREAIRHMMFTMEQIDGVHERLGNAETLLAYVQALKALGVETYDSYVTDGHSEFFGAGGHKVVSPPYHEKHSIAETSSREAMQKQLKLHEQGETDYFEMSRGLAESGIEKWTVDTTRQTMSFLDKAGNALLVEKIE